MFAPPPEILLVTPVWNDSARLAGFGTELAQALANSPLPIHWIIADDGSTQHEHRQLKELQAAFSQIFPKVQLHFAAQHHGKGAVVREAWSLRPEAAWLAFVDADGSVTPREMLRLIDTAMAAEISTLGIRKLTHTTQFVESRWRGIFHRGFLLAAHLLLDLQCEDPQCGAKILRGTHYRRIAHGLSENGLAFDSELLCALKRDGATWSEIPVTWIQKPGSKVRPLHDAWGVFKALLRIRKRLRQWVAAGARS